MYTCNVRNVTTVIYHFDSIQCSLKYRRSIEFYFFVAFIGYPFLHFINNFIKEVSCKSVLYRIDNVIRDTKMARSQVTFSAPKHEKASHVGSILHLSSDAITYPNHHF